MSPTCHRNTGGALAPDSSLDTIWSTVATPPGALEPFCWILVGGKGVGAREGRAHLHGGGGGHHTHNPEGSASVPALLTTKLGFGAHVCKPEAQVRDNRHTFVQTDKGNGGCKETPWPS